MFIDPIRDALLGRNTDALDNLIYRVTKGRITGWSLANKIKNRLLAPGAGVSEHKLIVIGGCPRSGTTLLQMLLKAHDRIDGPYKEVSLFEDYRKYQKLSAEFGIPENRIRELRREAGRNNLRFFDQVFETFVHQSGIDFPLLKAPKSIFLFGHLLPYYPKIRFIHLMRDGRDASLSMQRYFLKRTGKQFPFSYGVKTWAASIREGFKFRNYHENYIEVKYEDLTAEPAITMRRVFEFIGISEFDEKRIVDFNQHIEPHRLETHENEISKPITNTSVSRWKTEMTSEQHRIFEKFGGESLLTELGYEASG